MSIELRRENQTGVPLSRALVPRYTEREPEAVIERREPITKTCDGCHWPAICLDDGTCWEVVRTEREQARQERRRAPRATTTDRKEKAMEGLAELEAKDRSEHMNGSAPAAITTTCKVPDCVEPWLTQRGRFAKLCAEHKSEALAKTRGKPAPKPRAKKAALRVESAKLPEGFADLRALAGGLRSKAVTVTRWDGEQSDDAPDLADRLASYLEAQGLIDRRLV